MFKEKREVRCAWTRRHIGKKCGGNQVALCDLGQLGTTLSHSFLNIKQTLTQPQKSWGTKQYNMKTTSEGVKINKEFQTWDTHDRICFDNNHHNDNGSTIDGALITC